ncbi:DNA (cytosine-5)-methyltransferase 1 [Fibrobacter sp. UWB16]|uniref:DNA cytosine methyltransferase n=1 Tax=unclassified Fibrobacter TaxID=2634177 RepID=UPI000BC9C3EE|nr:MULTISPECIES: DNA (cytosine-5-)-methyltransferase [unclassified Fibrobacter]SOD13037.1 DNA (cytosine-5)-methyltransferase 1 [Fibrobacter sp. UWB16]
MKNILKVASVFSGIGAPEFALKRSGIPHKLVFACDNGEIDLLKSDEEILENLKGLSFSERRTYIASLLPKRTNHVKKSFLANYDLDEKHFHHNVKLLDGTEYKNKVDLFIGGSPCQSFTLLGYQKGLEEARGTLFYEFARLIKEIEPKAFIYENVQGLVKHDGGKTWDVVQRVFASLGYTIHYQIMDAVNYGIPQKRRRIFVVGFKRGGENFEFPPIKELNYTLQDFLLENTPEGNFTSNNGEICIKHAKGEIPEKYYLSEKILPGILSEGSGGFSMKPEIDLKIARPLMRTMHKMHRAGEDNYVTTNGRIRRLIPRECLRLMGFTDDFKQVVSDCQMYQQAGNSMVVDVMMALIKEVKRNIKI